MSVELENVYLKTIVYNLITIIQEEKQMSNEELELYLEKEAGLNKDDFEKIFVKE